jgi:hypothetical protein
MLNQDPLAEMLAAQHGVQPDTPEYYWCERDAAAVRAYYRERRPTREEIADRLKLFRKTKIGVGTVHHHTDALFALFDRVWEEK